MAEAVVSTTLDTLRNLLVEEVRFVSGVRNQVEELERELLRMKCFLKDADTRKHKDERVQNWVREVKDLCYQVEDVLEMFVVEVASKRSSGKGGVKEVVKRLARLPSEGIALHKVGVNISRIKAQIIDLRTSLQTYGVQELRDNEEISDEASKKQWRLRQTYAHEVDEHFVGMEDEIKKLVSAFVKSNNNRHHDQDRVVSIYGMGGIGKTTLARKIYHHTKVKHCFEAFAWHCISQQYDFKLVLRDILKQLVGESKRSHLISYMEEAELVRELNNVQVQNKCFIVVDDVWNIDDWRELRKAFPLANQAARSKILLTTRNQEVAQVAGKGYQHKLRTLTEEEGWQLLQKMVFFGQEEQDVKTDQKLESVGREILGKCGGLPLAISALGGILKSRNTLSEWETVSKDVDLYLTENEANKEGSGSPVHVLGLSYHDLPYNLKPCFLYMGIFQEDEEIEARKLCHLWIVEGMVSSVHRRNEETMMDLAGHILSELASRSMVQVKADNGRIKSCKLHDLMRDLCLKKGKEEGFLENLYMDYHGGSNARRLAICFQGSLMESSRQIITNQFLRALSVHRAPLRGPLDYSFCRVLDFQKCAFQESKLPKEISKMVHLRYLSVYGCYLRKLPSFIGDLQYLEVLDLRTLSELYLPNIFSKMKRLRHLYLHEFHCGLDKLQLNGLSGLETLVGFKSEGFRHKDLSELTNLQYFDAVLGSDDWSLIIDHINSWETIKWVKIRIGVSSLEQTHFAKLLTCRNLNDLEVHRSPIHKLPQYELHFCPNLFRLYLYRTMIDEESMELLKKLPKLRELILYSYAFCGEEFICDATDFPQLRSLKLHFQPNLERWRIDEGALPNLSSLLINDNKQFEIIPEDGLRHLTNLKELEIIRMPEEFRRKYGVEPSNERI